MNLRGIFLLQALAAFLHAGTALAAPLEYELFIVDSQGNKVSGLKTEIRNNGHLVPLVGELAFNTLSMTVTENKVRLNGEVRTCIGSNGCGSRYANQLFSLNTVYGVPVGRGRGTLNLVLDNELAASTTEARLFGAETDAGRIRINRIDPILPESYASVSLSTRSNPNLGYAFGIFADAEYGLDLVHIDSWLVLNKFFAATSNNLYIETRAGSGKFDFSVVGCLVGGTAGGVCGGTQPPIPSDTA